jgi:hypothetical protein
MSTTSQLKKSSRQLVGRLTRKVESDSPVEILGAPGRLVDDLKIGGDATGGVDGVRGALEAAGDSG